MTPANQILYRICQSSTAGACVTSFTVNLTSAPGATSHTVTGLSAGTTYCFVVRAEDQAGNRDTNIVEKCAVIPMPGDTTPPAVSLTAPTANASLSATFTLKATASDNSGTVSKVEFFLQGFSNPLCADEVPKPSNSVFSCNWDTTLVGNGSYTFFAKATDPSGNFANSVGVTASIDNPIPAGTVIAEGQLNLPAPLQPSDFLVGNMFQTVTPDDRGGFRIPVRVDGITVTSAVPKTYTDEENVWVAVSYRFPEQVSPQQVSPEVLIDATSTARAMVFLNPMSLTYDPYKAKAVFDAMDGLSEIQALAREVTQKFPSVTRPMDDEDFSATYLSALGKVIDAIPPVVQPSAVTVTTEDTATPSAVLRDTNPRVQWHVLDWVYQIELDSPKASGLSYSLEHLKNCTFPPIETPSSDEPNKVKVQTVCGVPLDSLVRVQKVDILKTHQLGTESFQLNSMEDVFELRHRPDQFSDFATDPAYPSKLCFASANSFFKYFDILGNILDAYSEVLQEGIGIGTESDKFAIDPNEDAIYLVRSVNGRLFSGMVDTFGEGSFAWKKLTDDHISALVLNVVNGGIDALSVFLDVKDLLKTCLRNVFYSVDAKLGQEVASLIAVADFNAQEGFVILIGLATEAFSALLGCLTEEAAKKPLKGLAILAKSLLKSMDVIGKFSRIGQIIDRVAGLSGLPIWISALVSPMDTSLVVVGDPFSPKITRVIGAGQEVDPANPPASLPGVKNGDPLILEGKRFKRRPTDPIPVVYITDETGKTKELKGFAVEDVDTQSPPTQSITSTVPDGLSGKLKISISTSSGSQQTKEVLEVIPQLFRSAPGNIFPNDPHPEHKLIQVTGKALIPSRHKIMVGSSEVTPIPEGSSNTILLGEAPTWLPPGKYEVKIRWRGGEPDVGGTHPADGSPNPQYLRILGPPSIDAVTPASLKHDQPLIINGKNFGEIAGEVDLLFHTDFPTPFGQDEQVIPGRIFPGNGDGDQQATLLVTMPLGYSDPNPDTDNIFEPMPATVKVKTPEGESRTVNFNVVTDAPAPYYRWIEVPYVPLSAAISYANQDPAPAGSVEQAVVCDNPGFCGTDSEGNPIRVNYGDCHITYPDSYVPIPRPDGHGHLWTKGVIPPPGVPAADGSCNTCQGEVSCYSPPGPVSWEGIPPEQIEDAISIYPREDAPGNISLTGILRGPRVGMLGGPTDYGKIVGGGLVIEGDGKDGTPRDIYVQLVIEEATGTVITVRNARGVDLLVDIKGSSCDTGILVQNSKEVVINYYRIEGCTKGIVVENSEQVEIRNGIINGYQTGILIDGGSDNYVNYTQLGFRPIQYYPEFVFVIPSGQKVGIHLKGNTTRNTIVMDKVVGNTEAGLWLESGSENVILPAEVGVLIGYSEARILKTDSNGTPTANGVGIKLSRDAVNNEIYGPYAKSLCPSAASFSDLPGFYQIIGTNTTGILMEGGENNEVCGNYVGVTDSFYTLPQGGVGNEVGILLKGSIGSQPRSNFIRNNFIGDNHRYGIEVDGVVEENIIADNLFGKDLTLPNPPNHICGLHITNASENLQVHRNFFSGEKKAICIEDSRNLTFFNNLIVKSEDEGIRMERSHSVLFDTDQICGGQYTGDCGTERVTDTGMHIIASSDFRLRKVKIQGMSGDGIEIEQPPVQSFGFARLEGVEPGGTVVGPPERKDTWDPVRFPPQTRISESHALIVRHNSGRGIYIHDGAKDIVIAGAWICNNASHGIHLVNPGENITVQESRIGPWEFPPCLSGNQGDGIRIEGSTLPGVAIGAQDKGNVIKVNGGWGIYIKDSEKVRVQGNSIGTNQEGTMSAGNASGGIHIEHSNDILVGGNDLKSANLISGNGGPGIQIVDFLNFPSPPIQIEGNFIGTTYTGKHALPNNGNGIKIKGRGAQPSLILLIVNNLIAGNAFNGIFTDNIGDQKGPLISGNIIGKWTAGPVIGVANQLKGILLDTTDNTIIQSNRIANNLQEGVLLSGSSRNILQFNTVESQGKDGAVFIWGSDQNTLASNTIKSNGGNGIEVFLLSIRNTLTANSITSHPGKGISLRGGGNNHIPEPIIRAVGKSFGGEYSFFGEVSLSIADGARVELFVDEDDEGRIFLASTTTYNHTFSFSGVKPPPGVTFEGKKFHATVTDLQGNTSEFGPYDPVIPPPPPRKPPKAQPPAPPEFDFLASSTQNDDIALTNIGSGVGRVIVNGIAPDMESAVCEDNSGNQFVALASNREGNWEIYLTNPSGSPLTNITNNPAEDIEPSFSPDCSQIVFVSNRDGNYEIYRMNRDGSNVTRLTNDPAEDRQPDWSPDASRIAFSSSRTGSFQIYTMNSADGSNVQQRTTSGGVNRHPSWRKIADKIAFEHCIGMAPSYTPCQIGILTLSTGANFFIPSDGWSDEQPEWFLTPDGTAYLLISSVSPEPGDTYHLYLITLDGYLLWQITQDDAVTDRSPSCCLSP
ncbi:MAG: right-handed parallel beta-helix repeat-containing protein [bacterium JZ-2024 1]